MVSEKNKGFVAIAHAVCNIADSDFDRYWISSRFFMHLEKFRDTLRSYVS